jgi:hypothetical protein
LDRNWLSGISKNKKNELGADWRFSEVTKRQFAGGKISAAPKSQQVRLADNSKRGVVIHLCAVAWL